MVTTQNLIYHYASMYFYFGKNACSFSHTCVSDKFCVVADLELCIFRCVWLQAAHTFYFKEVFMAKMECPICGRKFDEEYVEYLDNGNPACPSCVTAEEKRQNKKDEDQ